MAEKGKERRSARRPAEAPPEPGETEGGKRKPPVCDVAFCPICMVVTSAQGVAPEGVEHLLNAAREFFLAARAVIDARADDLKGERRAGPSKLEKIEIA